VQNNVERSKNRRTNPQVRLFIDLRDRSIQRSLAEVRRDRQGRFLNNVSTRIFDRLQAENFSEFLQRNARGSGLDVLSSPAIEPQCGLELGDPADKDGVTPKELQALHI
jgi:hypothetical protein